MAANGVSAAPAAPAHGPAPPAAPASPHAPASPRGPASPHAPASPRGPASPHAPASPRGPADTGGRISRVVADDLLPPAPAPELDTPGPQSGLARLWARRWHLMIGVITVLSLLGVCALFSWQLVQDELAGRHAVTEIVPEATEQARDISTRESDPEPLTVDEVFPSDDLIVNPDDPPYEVLGTQDSDDCGVAAADALAELLSDLGCSQVVRATMRSPDEEYLITAGIFNLETEDEAANAYDDIHPIIDESTGRFVGLVAGPDTEAIMISQTHLGWDYRGHYLIYAVIARSDGGAFSASDDLHADRIIWDMVEEHLRSGVLGARATAPAVDSGDNSAEADESEDDQEAEGETEG